MSRVGALLLLSSACATAESIAPADFIDPGADVETLYRLERARAKAIAEGDAFVLRALLDDGFMAIDPDGTRRNAAQLVERIRSEGRVQRHVRIRVDDFVANITQDSAVTTGRDVREEDVGDERRVSEVAFTHTWRWRDGAWRLRASHESAVPR